MSEIQFYSILDEVVADVHFECGYIKNGDVDMPAVIAGDDVTFFEDIDEARAAYWGLVGR